LCITENDQNGLGRCIGAVEEISEILNRLEAASMQDRAKCVRLLKPGGTRLLGFRRRFREKDSDNA
jgi:hypothetical protein